MDAYTESYQFSDLVWPSREEHRIVRFTVRESGNNKQSSRITAQSIHDDTAFVMYEQRLNASCRAEARSGRGRSDRSKSSSFRDEDGTRVEEKMYFIPVLVLLGTGLTVNSGESAFCHTFKVRLKAKVKGGEAVTSLKLGFLLICFVWFHRFER